MSVSVVLSTYNGEKYIIEQLESLRAQNSDITEVIVGDDCSSDATWSILVDYISKYNLSNWILYKNEENIGWRRNFIGLLQKAKGELIFLCDQDDVWHLDKIKCMAEIMEKKREILLLASDFTTFYENSSATEEGHYTSQFEIQKVNFSPKVFYVTHPGCTYCLRRSLLKYIGNYWYMDYPHDAFLWRTAALVDGLYIFNKSMINYRRHDNNATGHEIKDIKYRKKEVQYYLEVANRMLRFVDAETVNDRTEKRRIAQRYVEWSNLRSSFLSSKRVTDGIKLLHYIDCYWSWKTYVADWLVH